MLQQSSKDAASGLARQSAYVIHYNLSYVVQGAEYGTDGAIVLDRKSVVLGNMVDLGGGPII